VSNHNLGRIATESYGKAHKASGNFRVPRKWSP